LRDVRPHDFVLGVSAAHPRRDLVAESKILGQNRPMPDSLCSDKIIIALFLLIVLGSVLCEWRSRFERMPVVDEMIVGLRVNCLKPLLMTKTTVDAAQTTVYPSGTLMPKSIPKTPNHLSIVDIPRLPSFHLSEGK
jgi:hypothetical protein